VLYASSLNSNPAQNELHIYPNPVKDKINIQSAVEATYILRDGKGNIITTQKINGNGSINVSRLQPGIYYLLNMETGNSYKILKN
jgi:type IX secretion system substrate protein